MPKPLGASPEAWSWFSQRLALGAHLLPAVPDPQAPVAPDSKLSPQQLGKVPSRYREDGMVVGFGGWVEADITPVMVRMWSIGRLYNICVRGRGACAFDLDVEDKDETYDLLLAVREATGHTFPIRYRENSARVLLPFRFADGELLKEVVAVRSGNVELLGTRQQWIAAGLHPKSGQEYRWSGEGSLPDFIPTLTREQVQAAWIALGGGRLKTEHQPEALGPALGKDPVPHFLTRQGLVRELPREGRWPVMCPWVNEHTMDGGVWESVWHEAGSGGYAKGHYHCFHAACASRSDDEFLAAINYRLPLAQMFEFDPEAPPPATENDRKPDTIDAAGVATAAAGGGAGGEDNPDGPLARTDRTDVGNTNLLARLSDGNLRYSWEMGLWLYWTGTRWVRDEPGEHARTQAVAVAEWYRFQAMRELSAALDLSEGTPERTEGLKRARDTREWSFGCRNRVRLGAMLEGAKADGRFLVRAAALDVDPWLLGTPGGVVDLRTGSLRPAARDEFITRSTSVTFNPEARCPRWEAFLEEITGLPGASASVYVRRPGLAAYLRRFLGLLMTGVVTDQKLFIAWGAGSNGKNMLFDTLVRVLGDYAQVIKSEVLMAADRADDAHRATPEVRKLHGARLAFTSETREGQKLDTALVKSLTGDGLLTARSLHENPITFARLFKPVLLTNSKPGLDHLDPAIRGRVHLIPFERQWLRPGESPNPRLPAADTALEATLKGEAEGILAWLVQAAAAYYREGLGLCKEVEASTQAYFAEQDPIGRWLTTVEPCDPRQGATAQELYQHLTEWAQEEDVQLEVNVMQLGRILSKRGISTHRTQSRRNFGLKVAPPAIA